MAHPMWSPYCKASNVAFTSLFPARPSEGEGSNARRIREGQGEDERDKNARVYS